MFKHTMKAAFFASISMLVVSSGFASSDKENVKEFITDSNKVKVTQSGGGSGIVIQQDDDGTKITSWDNSDDDSDTAESNEIIVTQGGHKNTVVIHQGREK